MPRETTTITICMGSSCFSRGNKTTLATIQQYLKDKHLQDSVILKGAHCVGKCDKGPVIHINDKEILMVSGEKLESILDACFGFAE